MKTGLLQFKALEIAEAWQAEGIGAAAGLLSVPRNGPAGAYLAAMVLAHMIRHARRPSLAMTTHPEELCVDLAQAIGNVAPGSDKQEE